MPIHFEIVEDGHVIYGRVTDPWTMQDYQANVKADLDHRDSVSFPVHTLLNLSQIKRYIPPDAIRVRKTPTLNHSRPGKIAVVGASSVLKLFGETIMRLTRSEPAQFFDTEEEAWVYLRGVIRAESADAPVNQT